MKARLVWLLLCAIWGSTWLFIKIGLDDLPPISFAGMRFVLASLILVALIVARRTPLPRRRSDWTLILGTGLLAFTLNYGLLFWGEQHVSSGLAALLQATIPVFGLAFAHLYLPGERMTILKVAGVLLGVVGVGVIVSNQLRVAGSLALWGSLAIVAGGVCMAYANVLVKARGGQLDTAVMAAGQMICGLVPLVVVGWAVEGSPLNFHWTGRAVTSLLYLAVVGSVVAFLLYYWLVRNMDVTTTMLIALVTPLVAVLLGLAVLDERLTWRTLAGGALILSGISTVVRPNVNDRAHQLPRDNHRGARESL
jgi:drug/metabolite transporter (DMT)-like permease